MRSIKFVQCMIKILFKKICIKPLSLLVFVIFIFSLMCGTIKGQNTDISQIKNLLSDAEKYSGSDFTKSLILLDSLDKFSLENTDFTDLNFYIFFLRGNINKLQYKHKEAEFWYGKAENEIKLHYKRDNYIMLIVNRANNLFQLDIEEKAMQLCDEAINICKENTAFDMLQKCKAYYTKGTILLKNGDTLGIENYRKSEELALKIDFKANLGSINYELAKLYKNLSNYSQSIFHCHQAIKYFDKNDQNVSIVYNVWAQNLQEIGEYEAAANMYNKMISSPGIAPRNKVYGLNSYGILLKDLKKFDDAEKVLIEGLELAKIQDLKQKEAEILANIGAIYFDRMDYESAYKYYIQAKDIFFDKNLNVSLINKMYLIEMIIQTGVKERREGPLFDQYIALRDSLDQENLKNINSQFVNKYESEKKGKEILELKNRNFLIDLANLNLEKSKSLLEKEKLSESINLIIQKSKNDSLNFSIEEKALINKELIAQAEINDQKLKQQRNFLLLTGMALTAILSLFALLYYQYKKKNSLNLTLNNQKTQIQLLNRELNHRVKNNLTFMTSLLEMQSRRSDSIETKSALKESESRLKALALVHSQLFKSDSDTEVNLNQYLKDVTNHLHDIFSTNDKPIVFETQYIDFQINAEDAMRLGLIVNELVTNSVKHAFINVKVPQISIITTLQDGKLALKYEDNGPGISHHVVTDEHQSSLGIKLIDLLRKQLGDRYVVMV